MASKKTYPPKFVNTLIHPAEYNLNKLDVFKEAELGKYFNVKNLPPILSFGKHYFTILFDY